MDRILVRGGARLSGQVTTTGAKNAALPLMFASLLTPAPCRLRNVPDVADIRTAARLLERLGAKISRPAPGELVLECDEIGEWEAPYDLVRIMRASFLALGPLLARGGRARVSAPGGCAIGSRPIDQHVAGLVRLGARLEQAHGYVEARAKRLVGGHVIFESPSVGATENLLMAASLAAGTTRIENAAREPEVVDLPRALTAMGARIDGAGGSVVEVEGVSELGGYEHAVMPDRIVAGTYLIGGAITGGEVEVLDVVPDDLGSLLEVLEAAGCRVEVGPTSIRVGADDAPRAVDVTTAPHPGFPTDLQAQLMALMCRSRGTAHIHEAIFENRFMHVQELVRMGADIRLAERVASIHGGAPLTGAPVMATDLRASVCLVLAGLAAEGTTEILRVYHLDRGYERLEDKLRALGADIERVSS